MRTEKTKGPQKRALLPQIRLERCDVSSDFHGDGNDFGFGLGPGHDVRSA
jgi:hypothetical protein